MPLASRNRLPPLEVAGSRWCGSLHRCHAALGDRQRREQRAP